MLRRTAKTVALTAVVALTLMGNSCEEKKPETEIRMVPVAIEIERPKPPAECGGDTPGWIKLPERDMTIGEAWATGGQHYNRMAGPKRVCAAWYRAHHRPK